jgi:hypothetical protein
MTNTPELEAMDEKIRFVKEHVIQDTERTNTLPPTKTMTTLLANMRICLVVEQLKEEQQNITWEL